MASPDVRQIRPQPGPQLQFLSSAADIAIYGGAAGGGKTWALLIEPLRHIANGDFGAVFFRRTTVQVRNEGGLWDESHKLYAPIGAVPRLAALAWRFASGATVSFRHLEHDKSVYGWQGSQIPLICFDELTHFSERQFWYLVSRNRSTCGVRPYVRATCNPDADSWVARFIAWWIDPETGLPIPERAAVPRWFVRIGDKLIWADRPQDLASHVDPVGRRPIPPKSVTFVPAKLTDNIALMAADPGYLANLMAQPTVERERLLLGNWKVRPAAGLYFQRGWCKLVDAAPMELDRVRGWDLAATPKTERNDPDWTAGTKIGRDRRTGRFLVLHHVRTRDTPALVQALISNTATQDGAEVEISLPQDPGQAGKAQIAALVLALEGFVARGTPETGDKLTRFGPFSAQAQAGNVDVLRGAWNEDWFNALEGFPDSRHDDDADSTSRAFNAFLDRLNSQGLLDLVRRQETARAPTLAPGSVEWGLANHLRG
jgi:predicted phage terminase large subunit-like protein